MVEVVSASSILNALIGAPNRILSSAERNKDVRLFLTGNFDRHLRAPTNIKTISQRGFTTVNASFERGSYMAAKGACSQEPTTSTNHNLATASHY